MNITDNKKNGCGEIMCHIGNDAAEKLHIKGTLRIFHDVKTQMINGTDPNLERVLTIC